MSLAYGTFFRTTGEDVGGLGSVTFTTSASVSNLTFTASSTDITVTTAGDYLVSWQIYSGSSLVMGVTVNGTSVPSTIREEVFSGSSKYVTGDGVVTLAVGDVVRLSDLRGSEITKVDEPFNAGAVTAILTLTRLGP